MIFISCHAVIICQTSADWDAGYNFECANGGGNAIFSEISVVPVVLLFSPLLVVAVQFVLTRTLV